MTKRTPRRSRGRILALMCHGDPERCYTVGGEPLPLCARCIAFYPMFLIVTIISIPLFMFVQVRAVAMTFLFTVLTLPLVVDGVTQYIGMRRSNNPLRTFTGALAGTGCGLALTYLVSRLFLWS